MKKLTDSEIHTLNSLLWIVNHDEDVFKKVLSLFNQSRDDLQTREEFLANLHSLEKKTSKG